MSTALLLSLLLAASPAQAAGPRRFAFAVASNRGTGADVPLRYAERDARAFLSVLEEAGGLAPGDATLVSGATADSVRAGLARLERRLAAEARPGDQLFVYVSSHAAAGALHLSGTELPLGEVVHFVERAPVEVALLVVDSCQSGEAARLKGLVPVPEVQVQVERPAIAGRVILTASAADESAHESDVLAGSVFTQHLVAALRGAADTSRDGRVTLAEAYGYAYSRTVESSLLSRAGAQHPAFRMDLQGEGELVLTSPAQASSLLTLAIEEPGEWTVATLAGEPFLEQVRKGAGAATLALPAGRYLLTTRSERRALQAQVHVPAAGRVQLTRAQLVPRELATHTVKGGASPVTWRLAVGGSLESPLLSTFGAMAGGSAQLQAGWGGGLLNVAGATLGLRHGQDATGGLLQTDATLRLGVGHRARASDGTEVQLTVELGALLARQWQARDGNTRQALQPTAELAGTLWMPLAGPVRFLLTTRTGLARVRTASDVRAVWTLGGGLGLGVDL